MCIRDRPATTTEAATDIQPAVASSELWKPVISDLQALGEEHCQEDMSWLYIFITGFLGGLLALFTPCAVSYTHLVILPTSTLQRISINRVL